MTPAERLTEQTRIRTALPSERTALEATKRGYGLWRGEVIHPADPRMDEIVASDDPITDTKGLGLRYVPVRGARAVPHFRVHDPERFSAALDRMYPAVHDAVVRLVAGDIETGGFEALQSWCASDALPEPFTVANVAVENRYSEDGVGYRPDIAVLHPEGGRIELEVVNTHAPETRRLDAAWGAGHIVLGLRIRDLVEDIVFSEGRGTVPDDATLLEMLRGRRFRLCGRERVPESVHVVWRDLNLSAYATDLRAAVRSYWRGHFRDRIEPVGTVTWWGSPMSAIDDPEHRAVARRVYEAAIAPFPQPAGEKWLRNLRFEVKQALVSGAEWEAMADAYGFLENFGRASASRPYTSALRKLRVSVRAVEKLQDMYQRSLDAWAEDLISEMFSRRGAK